jgi:MOSC domain-containing protein YiiM
VPLNHLVGKRFRVGTVLLHGARLNVPCKYLEQVTGKPVYEPLVHRSGLNCEIVEGGVIRAGDLILPA